MRGLPIYRPGYESAATTQIYTNVGQERMEQVMERL